MPSGTGKTVASPVRGAKSPYPPAQRGQRGRSGGGGEVRQVVASLLDGGPSRTKGAYPRLAWSAARNPYPRLRSFDEEDAVVFFGRSTDGVVDQAEELLTLAEERAAASFLAVLTRAQAADPGVCVRGAARLNGGVRGGTRRRCGARPVLAGVPVVGAPRVVVAAPLRRPHVGLGAPVVRGGVVHPPPSRSCPDCRCSRLSRPTAARCRQELDHQSAPRGQAFRSRANRPIWTQ